MAKRNKTHKSKKNKAFATLKQKVKYERPAPPIPDTEMEVELIKAESGNIAEDKSVESDEEDR